MLTERELGNGVVLNAIQQALAVARLNKPNDRSAANRAYAVTITDLEKVLAYFKTFVVEAD